MRRGRLLEPFGVHENALSANFMDAVITDCVFFHLTREQLKLTRNYKTGAMDGIVFLTEK